MTRLQFLPEEFVSITKTYKIKTVGSYAVMKDFYEYSDEFNLKFTSLNKEANTITFFLEIELTNHSATNNEFNFRHGLLEILKELRLTTDFSGEIEKIYNIGEIRENWIDVRYDLERTYSKQPNINEQLIMVDDILQNTDKLNSFVEEHGCFPLILTPLIIDSIQYPYNTNKKLSRFLGDFDLPICKAFTLNNSNKETVVTAKVAIDYDNFNKKPFTKWLKKEIDIYDLKVKLELDAEETYVYDEKSVLIEAEHYLAVGVIGCFSNTIARTLTESKLP